MFVFYCFAVWWACFLDGRVLDRFASSKFTRVSVVVYSMEVSVGS